MNRKTRNGSAVFYFSLFFCIHNTLLALLTVSRTGFKNLGYIYAYIYILIAYHCFSPLLKNWSLKTSFCGMLICHWLHLCRKWTKNYQYKEKEQSVNVVKQNRKECMGTVHAKLPLTFYAGIQKSLRCSKAPRSASLNCFGLWEQAQVTDRLVRHCSLFQKWFYVYTALYSSDILLT